MAQVVNMDNILDFSLGERSNSLEVEFKKTLFIRDYETEVIDSKVNIQLDRQLSGMQRAFVCAVVRAQLEYEAYVSLLAKGSVTQTEFMTRKTSIESEINNLIAKAEAMFGAGYLDEFMSIKGINGTDNG